MLHVNPPASLVNLIISAIALGANSASISTTTPVLIIVLWWSLNSKCMEREPPQCAVTVDILAEHVYHSLIVCLVELDSLHQLTPVRIVLHRPMLLLKENVKCVPQNVCPVTIWKCAHPAKKTSISMDIHVFQTLKCA